MNAIDSLDGWGKAFLQATDRSVLNDPDFIALVERVYRCRANHLLEPCPEGWIGVPCFRVVSLLSGKKLTSCPFNFYPPLIGPCRDVEALQAMIRAAQSIGPDYYVEYKTFHSFSKEERDAIGLVGIDGSVVSDLVLKDNYQAQVVGFGRSLRQNLRTQWRRAGEMGLTIDQEATEADLKAWYHLHVKLYRDKHRMITQPLSLFRGLLKPRGGGGLGSLLVARHNRRVVGGILLLKGVKRWEYSWSAYDREYAGVGVNTLLVDEAIRLACSGGVKVLGFGSSSVSDQELRYFKRRWGCEEKTIKYYYWNHQPRPFDLNNSLKLPRWLYSQMPVSVAERLPALIVPFLA